MKLILSLGFIVLFLSFRAFGPVEGGNAGDLVRCRPATGSPFEGLYALDFLVTYKVSIQNKDIVPVDSTAASLSRIGKILKEKAPGLYPSYKEFVELIKNTEDYSKPRVWEEASFGIVPLNNETLLTQLPENCRKNEKEADIIRAVYRFNVKPTSTGPIIYKYIPEVFDDVELKLPLQASFLLVHEWLWDHSLEIEKNRRVNRFLHSDRADSLSPEEFRAQLKGMGIDPGGTAGPSSEGTIVTGYTERFCVRNSKEAHCWGSWATSNYLITLAKKLFIETPGLTHAAMGYHHLCVNSPAGVECVAASEAGYLTQVPVLSTVQELVAGKYHTCALHEGEVSCWGDPTASKVPSLSNVLGIAAGGELTCALQNDRTLRELNCWGTTLPTDVSPKHFNSTTVLDSLSVDSDHVCALSGGRVDCWGSKNYNMSTAPNLTNAIGVVVLPDAACAATPTNLFCWGNTSWNGSKPRFKNARQIFRSSYVFCVWDDNGIGCWDKNGGSYTHNVPESLRRKE